MITIQSLEELIKEKCPDGILELNLSEVCTFKRGKVVTKDKLSDGNVPVIAGGLKPAYYCNIVSNVGETITVAGSGCNAGYVGYWTFPIYVSDAFTVIPNSSMNIKYVYYYLKSKQDVIYSSKVGAGIPHVKAKDISDFKIPVPPIQVQQEIVKFLDNLSSNTNGLIGCLEEEIKLRKEIYKGYLDEKVNVNTNLSSIGSLVETINGYAFKASDFKDNGKYNVLQIGNVHTSGLSLDKLKTTNFEAADKFKVINDDILMALTGNVGRTSYVDSIDDTYYINQRVLILRKGKNIDHKYLNYSLLSSKFINNALDNATGAAQPNLSSKWVDNYQISVPTLQEQQEIVKYLDVLTESTNGLVKCLEEEIKLRKQEYEFYRNKVLTF